MAKQTEEQRPPEEGQPQEQQPGTDQPRGDQNLLGGGKPGGTVDYPAADSPAAAEQAAIAALQDEWRERGPQAGDPDEAAKTQTEEMAGRVRDARQRFIEQREQRLQEEYRRGQQEREKDADALADLFREAYRRGYDLVPRAGAPAAARGPRLPRAPGQPDDETDRLLREVAAAPRSERLAPEGAGTYQVDFPGETAVLVEADSPEQACKEAMKRLGVRSSEAAPGVRKLR